MAASIISIGECMVELAREAGATFRLAYGGDTFNTAAYLARAPGVEVRYATAVGDDPYSDGIVRLAEKNGVRTDLVARCPGRMPGLYLIETGDLGERSFWYWRDRAPARELFDHIPRESLLAALREADVIYFSGVTLSILDDAGCDKLEQLIGVARGFGARIAMDSNYRPRAWRGGGDKARSVFERFWRLSDIGLPTFDDAAALWGDDRAEATRDRLLRYGVSEIAVKQGAAPAVIFAEGRFCEIAAKTIAHPVDTTAAGDAFNAGYLAGRLNNLAPEAAAELAHDLAGRVILHRGAVVPSDITEPAYVRLKQVERDS